MNWVSSLQPLWHQGPVSWKTVFPWTRWGCQVGRWGGDDSGVMWAMGSDEERHMKLLLPCAPLTSYSRDGYWPVAPGLWTPEPENHCSVFQTRANDLGIMNPSHSPFLRGLANISPLPSLYSPINIWMSIPHISVYLTKSTLQGPTP